MLTQLTKSFITAANEIAFHCQYEVVLPLRLGHCSGAVGAPLEKSSDVASKNNFLLQEKLVAAANWPPQGTGVGCILRWRPLIQTR